MSSSKAKDQLPTYDTAPFDDTRSLRILVATEYLPPYVSGISNRCKNWINGYKELGHHVTVASVTGTECDIYVPSAQNPWYPAQRAFLPFPPLCLLLQLLNFFQPVPYDVLHVVSPLCLAFLPLLPLFWLRGVAIYVSHHVYLEYYQHQYIHKSMRGFVGTGYVILFWLPLAIWASVVGIPSKTADYYVYAYSRRIHLLKSGVDTTLFTPERCQDTDLLHPTLRGSIHQNLPMHLSPSDALIHIPSDDKKPAPFAPVMVYVGRLAREKNVEFLIKALAHPTLQKATLILVGDGPERQSLESLAEETLGAAAVLSSAGPNYSFLSSSNNTSTPERPRIIFTGMLWDERAVAAHYAIADIFLSASESETFGFTVAEAMACGTPPLMVRAGAFVQVFGKLGHCMFEPGDMEDFCKKVKFVIASVGREEVREMSCKEFSIEASLRDLVGAYRSICRKGRGKGKVVETVQVRR